MTNKTAEKSSTRLAFNWPDDLVARIDAARGTKTRTAWVRELTERELNPPILESVPPFTADHPIVVPNDWESSKSGWNISPSRFFGSRPKSAKR
jgi:hypothetical protein